MTVVALIPLREGSKSIPKKNIKNIAGKPLCAWVLESASKSSKIDSVFVSTDSNEIAKIVESLDLGVKIIFRPKDLATDNASTESVMLHFMSCIPFSSVVTIQATSPLLTFSDLDQAINDFSECKLDSMLSAVRMKRFFWSDDIKPINYDPTCRPMRQDFKGTYMENGAFYITKANILKKYKCRLGGKIGIYAMDESTSYEIDEPEDWERVEKLMKRSIGYKL